mgnify:CR=1 FL=1
MQITITGASSMKFQLFFTFFDAFHPRLSLGNNLESMSSPRVVDVVKGSPADEAGVLVNEVFISMNGEAPRDVIQYQLLTDEAVLDVEVQRGGLPFELEIRKGEGEPLGVTVHSALFDQIAGLMVGEGIARVLSEEPENDRYLIPDVCLSKGKFLDGMSPDDLPREVDVVTTDGIALRRALEESYV